MKASEVVRRYNSGKRDFRRVNLRGQFFKGQNLAGADFSEADIRGAIFTEAILVGAKFKGAIAGINPYSAIRTGFIIICLSLSALSASLPLAAILTIFVVTIMARIAHKHDFHVKAIVLTVTTVLLISGLIALAVSLIWSVAVDGTIQFVDRAIFVLLVQVLPSSVSFGVLFILGSKSGIITPALAQGKYGFKAMFIEAVFEFLKMIITNTGGTIFWGADLTNVNFTEADLPYTDFRNTELIRTCWHKVNHLDFVRPGATYLKNVQVRQWLIGEGKEKNFDHQDLQGINLQQANLKGASFVGADLSEANLQRAILEKANLTEANAVGVDFTGARLTGACLEAWNIDSDTKLEQVNCRFVYLLENPKDGTDNRERRPSSGEFQPGEFTKLFREVLNTVDLIFRNGVDWKAFVTAFEKIQVENEGTELTIQSIENKGDGVVVVRVNIPPDGDKEKIHSEFTENYEMSLKALEETCQVKLESKDELINHYRQQNADMWLTINKLADKQPITVEVKAIADSKTMNESKENQKNVEVEMNFQKEVTGAAGKVEGDMVVNPKQSLAESASEIQQLLQILDQSYPSNLPADTQAEIDVAVKGIAKNPTLRERVVTALRAGGMEALKELVDNPYVNILVAAYEGWRNPQQ